MRAFMTITSYARKARNFKKSLYNTSPVNPSQPHGHNRPKAMVRLVVTSSLYFYKMEIVKEKQDDVFFDKLVTLGSFLPSCSSSCSCVSINISRILFIFQVLSPSSILPPFFHLSSIFRQRFAEDIQYGEEQNREHRLRRPDQVMILGFLCENSSHSSIFKSNVDRSCSLHNYLSRDHYPRRELISFPLHYPLPSHRIQYPLLFHIISPHLHYPHLPTFSISPPPIFSFPITTIRFHPITDNPVVILFLYSSISSYIHSLIYLYIYL